MHGERQTMTHRRGFLLAGATALPLGRHAQAQQPGRTYRLGWPSAGASLSEVYNQRNVHRSIDDVGPRSTVAPHLNTSHSTRIRPIPRWLDSGRPGRRILVPDIRRESMAAMGWRTTLQVVILSPDLPRGCNW